MRYVVPVVVVLALMAVMAISSTSREEPADFRFINRGSINSLDPASMSWMQDIRVALTVWEGLYSYHPETSAPVPAAASGVDLSEDERTYTFHLRPEARWHNGDPVTAHDFVFGWRRAIEPGTAADYSFFFNHIEGMAAYRAWRNREIERLRGIGDRALRRSERDAHLAEADRRFAETVRLRALDDKTLEVRLERPLPYFLDLCAFSTFLPVHREAVEAFRLDDDNGLIYYNEQWVKPGNAVYNGAFYLTDWRFKRSMWMKRNPYYWDRDNVSLETVEVVDADDPNTAWLLYSGGRVDWLSSIDTDYAARLLTMSGSRLPNALNTSGTQRNDIHAFPAFGTYFYNFNCNERLPDGRPNPFHDRRVRQAFTMAVDKQAIVDRIVRLGNPVATSFVPIDSIPGYPEVRGLPYDPDRARELLAEAGYPDGEGFPVVVILFNTESQHRDIAQAVVGMWERHLGVRGRIDGKEIKTFAEDKRATNFIICRAGWYGDYGDPTTFLDMFESENGNNDSAFRDPAYDAMLLEADREPDPQRRLERLAEVEHYLVNEGVPLLPVFQYVNIFAFDPDRVKHLHLTPRIMTVMKALEVTP